jgi:predicted ATPase
LTGGPSDQPVRLQTLRDTIAWSYDLLDAEEQRLFQTLSVFVGGWSVASAAAVCDAEDTAVLEGISSLIAKSLMRYEGDSAGEPRYGMLETIREFGLEQLAVSGQEATIRSRHADWCLAFAERARPHVKGPQAARWLEALEQEHANLRAALQWAVNDAQGAIGCRLAAA